jgi:1-acyl-sn-glycerol-3-phosphate acyltransferase
LKQAMNRPVNAVKRALRRRQRAEPPALLSTPRPSLTYRLISYLLVFPVYRLLFRGRTGGNARVPMEGAVVVVANHGSHLDPPLLGHALGRPVAFMAKAELFGVPLLGPIIRACGAYPVARGASDREAIRTASDRLEEGWAIGVFIDGTRQGNGRVNAPQAGAALLAARAGVPLLPVAIINSHRALGTGGRAMRLVPIHIRIGQLIPPPASRRRPDLDATTRACQEQINALLDQGLISPAAPALPPSPADPSP